MRYADFYGNNELRQAAFSYASLLGGRFISKDEHLVYMDAAGRSYVPPAANYGAEQMLRQVRQAASLDISSGCVDDCLASSAL